MAHDDLREWRGTFKELWETADGETGLHWIDDDETIVVRTEADYDALVEQLAAAKSEVERLRTERDLLIARWPTDDKPVVSVTST